MKNRRILFEYLVWNLLQLSVYLNVIFEKRTFYVQVSIFKTILEMVCETVFRSVVLLLKVTFDTVTFFSFFLIFSKGNHFPWIFVESKFSRIRTNIGIDNDDDSFAMECLLFVILCKWVILKYRIASTSSFLESFPMAV